MWRTAVEPENNQNAINMANQDHLRLSLVFIGNVLCEVLLLASVIRLNMLGCSFGCLSPFWSICSVSLTTFKGLLLQCDIEVWLWMLLSLCPSSVWLFIEPDRKQFCMIASCFLCCFCINPVSLHVGPFKVSLPLSGGKWRPINQCLYFSLQPCPCISFSLLLHSLAAFVYVDEAAKEVICSHLEFEHSENCMNQINPSWNHLNFRSLIWFITAVSIFIKQVLLFRMQKTATFHSELPPLLS